MIFILIILFFVLLIASISFRVVITHPISTMLYCVYDVYHYFKWRKFDLCQTGKLNCYAAHFGRGKTLSMVHYIMWLYYRYNDKKVFDNNLGCYVTQKIQILSNVDFKGIPYVKLNGLDQVVNMCMYNKQLDYMRHERTCIFVVIDEASAQLNSRNFKSNIDSIFLNTLITSRHYHMSIIYSSQKFKLTDKLMRDVTQEVIVCNKLWRIMIQSVYDADDLEFASDPTMVRPMRRIGYFIRNKEFRSYDTLAVVGRLKKSVDDNDFLSPAEILSLRDTSSVNNDNVKKPSKRLLRLKKHRTSGRYA